MIAFHITLFDDLIACFLCNFACYVSIFLSSFFSRLYRWGGMYGDEAVDIGDGDGDGDNNSVFMFQKKVADPPCMLLM